MLTSHKITSSESATDSAAFVAAVVLKAGGANATLDIDDSADGSGTVRVGLAASQNESAVVTFPEPVVFETAVYATISGSGAEAYIYTN